MLAVDLVQFDRLMRKLLPFVWEGEARELWEELLMLPAPDPELLALRVADFARSVLESGGAFTLAEVGARWLLEDDSGGSGCLG